MTFHEQLRLTFQVGSGVFLASALLFVSMYGARIAGYSTLGEVLFIVAIIVEIVAALALVPGLLGRFAHRWMWFNVITRSDRTVFGRTMAQRLLESPASPVLRLWLHIDQEGHDRDGRI